MLVVHLIPLNILDLLDLETGDSIKIGVFLSSTKRKIKHVRNLQLDTSDSKSIEVKRFKWAMRHINTRNEIDLYYEDGRNKKYPHVSRANYIAQEPVRREILNVHENPCLIAVYKIKILGPVTTFSVIGIQNPNRNPVDDGIMFQTGFGEDQVLYNIHNEYSNLDLEGASIEIKT
jgi:hypothetical protein